MAKKDAVNPTAKAVVNSMFDGPGKEERDAAKVEANASRDESAKEETAERVGSILDEVGETPAGEKPPEEAVEPAEGEAAKPEGDKPKEEAKPVETPAGDKPKEGEGEKPEPTVPLGVHLAERREKQALQAERDRLKAQVDAANAKRAEAAAKPKEAEDPEPDKIKHPIEWDEWDKRQIRREIVQLRSQNEELRKSVNDQGQIRELEVREREFDRMVGIHREVYAKESPEFTEKRDYLRKVMVDQFNELGMPPQFRGKTPEQAVDEIERELIGTTLVNNPGDPRAPFKRIEGLSVAYGYNYFKQAQGTKPNGTTNGKPAPKSDAERIAAGAKLADAAKTTTTMPGTSPKAPTGDVMDAEKFAAMKPSERRAYKKAHPEIIERIFGGEGDEGTIF